MILVDTSVWVDHLRRKNAVLSKLLLNGQVLTHAFIIGELSCGNLHSRQAFFENLDIQPRAKHADDAEVLGMIDRRAIWGRGIGWTDAHLLASALISRCRLWTLDRRLLTVACELDVAMPDPAAT